MVVDIQRRTCFVGFLLRRLKHEGLLLLKDCIGLTDQAVLNLESRLQVERRSDILGQLKVDCTLGYALFTDDCLKQVKVKYTR